MTYLHPSTTRAMTTSLSSIGLPTHTQLPYDCDVTVNIATEECRRSTEFKVQTKFGVNIYHIKRATTTENINGCFSQR